MFVMILFPIFVASVLMRLPFFPYILSFFSFHFYYQIFILEVTIYLKSIFKTLADHMKDFQKDEIIIGGDFNLVLDVQKDKKGGLRQNA